MLSKPAYRLGGARSLVAGRLQQEVGEVAIVGGAALAGQRQERQAVGDRELRAVQFGEQRGEAAARPVLIPAQEPLPPDHGGLLAGGDWRVKGDKRGGAQSEQARGEGAAQAAHPVGVEQGLKKRVKFAGFVRGKDVGAGVDYGRHGAGFQRIGHRLGLGIRGHEDGEVTRRHADNFLRAASR